MGGHGHAQKGQDESTTVNQNSGRPSKMSTVTSGREAQLGSEGGAQSSADLSDA